MFDDSSQKALIETTSNKDLMKISQMFDEWVYVHTMRFSVRFCSTLFHNVS
jgi:hypothetical protein